MSGYSVTRSHHSLSHLPLFLSKRAGQDLSDSIVLAFTRNISVDKHFPTQISWWPLSKWSAVSHSCYVLRPKEVSVRLAMYLLPFNKIMWVFSRILKILFFQKEQVVICTIDYTLVSGQTVLNDFCYDVCLFLKGTFCQKGLKK